MNNLSRAYTIALCPLCDTNMPFDVIALLHTQNRIFACKIKCIIHIHIYHHHAVFIVFILEKAELTPPPPPPREKETKRV